jgi:hypothetical protein
VQVTVALAMGVPVFNQIPAFSWQMPVLINLLALLQSIPLTNRLIFGPAGTCPKMIDQNI